MSRRNYTPKRREATEIKSGESKLIPILLAGITAFVGIVGSGLTWYSSNQATKQAMALSCISRFDQQEKLIREKTESFLTSYGEFLTGSGNKNITREEKRPLVAKTVTGAMALVAHAPLELGTPTLGLASSLIFAMDATDQQTVDHQAGQAGISMVNWANNYFKLMDDFQSQRNKCFD